jgi:hypothetical protein
LLEIISFIINAVVAILPVISEQGDLLEITGRRVGNNRARHCGTGRVYQPIGPAARALIVDTGRLVAGGSLIESCA